MLTLRRLGRTFLLSLAAPLLACGKASAPGTQQESSPPEPPPAHSPEVPVVNEPDGYPGRVEEQELAAALACGEEKIARYNEENEADDGEALLFEAARCYQDAGEIGKAIHALRAMIEIYWDGPHRAEGHAQLRELHRRVEADDGAVGTPRGERCLRMLDSATPEGSTAAALERAATCLYEAAYLGTALVLRFELAKRSLPDEQRLANEEAIAKLQSGLERLRARNEAWEAELLPPPQPAPATVASPTSDVAVPAAGPPTLPLTADVPAYAKLGYRATKRNKLRASIVELGPVHAPRSLSRLDVEGRPYNVFLTVPVLDPDADGSPRRPRVICEEETTRLGLALDGASLAVVTRGQTFVSPDRQRPAKVGAKTPGVRLAAGTMVQASEPMDGTTEIAYEGLFLAVTGFVPTDAVDLVFEPKALVDDGVRNGRLLDNVWFLDAPHGTAIARTQRAPGVVNELHVRTLGPTKDGHTLVRYQESDAFVVGWVPADDVETYARRTFQGGGGMIMGSGAGSTKDTIELDRGTLLVAPGSSEIVGVVTRDDTFSCGQTCGDRAPKIRMRACAHLIEVHAVPSDAVRSGG